MVVSLSVRLAEGAALALLIAQGIGVARMPFVEDRFFAWSPHDQRTDFRIEATHQGRTLTAREILERYHLPAVEWHGWGNLMAVIRTAEARQAPGQRWNVRVVYRVNLGPEQTRTWPAH